MLLSLWPIRAETRKVGEQILMALRKYKLRRRAYDPTVSFLVSPKTFVDKQRLQIS